MIRFDVVARPAPQGSKAGFVNPKTGRVVIKDSGGIGLTNWRDAVCAVARPLALEHGCLTGPLRLAVLFRFPMPASRRKSDRLAGIVWRTARPDSSKILRSLEDALVDAGLIKDDALIVEHWIRKVEVHEAWSGATITLGRMESPPVQTVPLPLELGLDVPR